MFYFFFQTNKILQKKDGKVFFRSCFNVNINELLQVEYVVRTQLGFSFDSLKTLHFITTFAVALDESVEVFFDEDGDVEICLFGCIPIFLPNNSRLNILYRNMYHVYVYYIWLMYVYVSCVFLPVTGGVFSSNWLEPRHEKRW